MKTILLTVDYYYPGYKAGGPLRTLINIIDQLGDEFRFKVLTRDRDFTDEHPYPGITPGVWTPVEKAEVCYLGPEDLSPMRMRRILQQTDYDAIYFNSLFSPSFTIGLAILTRFGLLRQVPVLLAPRGELYPGAMKKGRAKKLAFLRLARSLGLFNETIWHASTGEEADQIRSQFGPEARVKVACDMVAQYSLHPEETKRQEKQPGCLSAVFISRLSRKKNLHYALERLGEAGVEATFDLYGVIDDPDYWVHCQQVIEALPAHVSVNYKGPVEHHQVFGVLGNHDLFFLPTLGENYGHAIFEALLAGCPPLISDQTPWRLSEAEVGWDLPLDHPEAFVRTVREVAAMDSAAHRGWSDRARAYAMEHSRDTETLEENRELFLTVLEKGANRPV